MKCRILFLPIMILLLNCGMGSALVGSFAKDEFVTSVPPYTQVEIGDEVEIIIENDTIFGYIIEINSTHNQVVIENIESQKVEVIKNSQIGKLRRRNSDAIKNYSFFGILIDALIIGLIYHQSYL